MKKTATLVNVFIASVTLLIGIALLDAPASATVIVDDHFDDGNLTTNNIGVGTGFNEAKSQATIKENEFGSRFEYKSLGAKWRRGTVNSKDRYDFWQYSGLEFVRNKADISAIYGVDSDGSTLKYAVVGSEGSPSDDAALWNSALPVIELSITTSAANNDDGDVSITGGLSITNRYNQSGEQESRNPLSFMFDDAFVQDSVAGTGAAFSMSLDVNSDGYIVDVEGADITVTSGALSGSWADLQSIQDGEFDDGDGGSLGVGEAWITTEFQELDGDYPFTSFGISTGGTNNGTGIYEIDRHQTMTTVIPEPASMAMLAVGGGLLVGRSRRSRLKA